MECNSCECLRELAKAAAEALRTEAAEARYHADKARESGGTPDTAEPRPVFDNRKILSSVDRLFEAEFAQFGSVDKSRLLHGRYNNLQFAERLQEEIRDGLHQKDEPETAIMAAESLEAAADALDDIAAFGFIDCALKEP